MSDLHLDKKSTLGLNLMNESNNVDDKLVNKFPKVGEHNDTWLRERLQVHSCPNRDFFNTWTVPEPEVIIVKVVDKGAKQSSVSKCPTDTWVPPVDSKSRQL